jgi:tetratricopeptide (TPR) repeat protein
MNDAAKHPLIAAGFLLICVFLVFGRSLDHGFVFWDDDVHITQNPSVSSPSLRTTLAFWKTPHDIALTRTVWAGLAEINQSLHRPTLDPRIFHLTNLTVHGLSVVLVFFIVLLLTGSGTGGIISALVFGLHPLQGESVAWASGLKELLSGFFALASLSAFLSSEKQTVSRKKVLLYILSFLAFAASLCSKTTSAGLPIVMLILALFVNTPLSRPEKNIPESKNPFQKILSSLAGLVPFLLLSAAALLLSRSIQPEAKLGFVPDLFQRLVLCGESFLFYLAKILVPIGLIPHYDRLPQTVLATPLLMWRAAAGWLVILTGFDLLVLRQTRRWAPPLLVMFFFLLPVLGLIPFIYQSFSLTADRYAYLALLGPALFIGSLCVKTDRKAVRAALSVLIIVLALLSIRQTGFWKDTSILFGRTAAINPNSWVAYNNLGVAVSRTDPSQAAAYFRKALASRTGINPDLAVSHYNLGLALARTGDLMTAETHWTEAVRLKPTMVRAWNNLGLLYERQNRTIEALACFRRSLSLEPTNPDILFRAAVAARKRGLLEESRDFIREALRVRPQDPDYLSFQRSLP